MYERKKRQLLTQINVTKEKIKKIDYLRSCIHNGKFILNDTLENPQYQKVKKINNNLNIIKRVVKASYDQLLFQRGNNLDPNLAKKIKNKQAYYYIIYENSSIIDDFIIFKENNLIDLNHNNLDSAFYSYEIMNLIFDKLKHDYQYITILIDIKQEQIITLAKQYNFIKDSVIIKNKTKYIQMKKIFKQEEL